MGKTAELCRDRRAVRHGRPRACRRSAWARRQGRAAAAQYARPSSSSITAILKAGGTVVNFNPLYSLEEIAFQASDSGTKIMVTLDLAAPVRQGRGHAASGALDKAVVASFAAALPRLKSVGFKLAAAHGARRSSASPQGDKIVADARSARQ